MKKKIREQPRNATETVSPLRIELLGPLRISIRGEPLPTKAWDRRQTQSLLKLLLTAPGRIFSSEEIIDLLWPTLKPDEAAKSLRAAVSKLRKVLEPDLHQGRLSRYILTERSGYAFVPSSDVILDTDEVQLALRQGQEMQKQEQWEEAIAHYRSALSRFRDEFLSDEPETLWLSPHREQWRKIRRALLLAQTDCHLFLGRYPSAIEAGRAVLEIDRCDEEAYRKLMLLHYLSGHMNGVEVLFKQCGDALREDLGVDPSEETVRLHDQIRRRRVPGIDKTVRPPVEIPRTGRVPHSLGRLRLIGREKEIGLIAAHLEAAVGKKGSVVALGGEPGVGKTRLAEEVLVYARSKNFLTATGRCYAPALRRPYEPFVEIFREILNGPRRSSLLSLSSFHLACAGQVVPEIPIPSNAPVLPPLPSEQVKQRLFEALTQLLIGLSEDVPLALFLDDIHWAEDETLAILHHLVRQLSQGRVLVILTYRTEEASTHPVVSQLLAAIQRASSRVLSLAHLPREAILELFRTMTAKGGPPELTNRLAIRLYEETQGNPLFVIEVLQALIEKERLKVDRRGKWTVSVPEHADQISWEIPGGIRRVILSRLERIDPEHRKALEILSTLSRGFTHEFLERLLEPEGIDGAIVLDSLLRLGFLQEDPHLKGAYRFTHENIRQTVYEALSPGRKKGFHLRAARTLESFPGPDASAPELAHHFLSAEAWPKAFQYLKDAAEAARRTFAYGAALSFLDQAERILSLHGSGFLSSDERIRQRLHLFKQKDHLLDELDQTKKREKVVAETIRLARKLGDRVELAGAYLSLSALRGANREWDEAIELAKQALALYEEQGQKDGAAKAYREMGYTYWGSGQLEKALEVNQKALHLHEASGNFKGAAGDLHNLGQVYTSMGDYEKGLEYYRKARWAFRKIGERNEEGRTLNILSRIARLTGNQSEALSNTLEALALHREENDRYGEIHYLLEAASLYLGMGNSEAARASYETALQLSRKMGGNTGREGHALRGLGIIHEQRGDAERAEACFSEAAALLSEAGDLASWADVCRRLGDLMVRVFQQGEKALHYYNSALNYYRKEGPPEALSPLLSRMGHANWVIKKPEEAIALYLEALELACEQRDRAAEGATLAALSVVYREAGHIDKSLDSTLRARDSARSLQDRLAEGYVLSSLCDTYLAMSRYPEAEEAARAALDLRAGSEDPTHLAWAQYRLGKVLKECGKGRESRAHLDKALALAQELGDQELLKRITLSSISEHGEREGEAPSGSASGGGDVSP
ncbi:MAG: tetratricopeptide repeat protein [Nitrospirae bacterium]|nr:tetratricopeptide repeat protein [Nitrospirota bacterium]